MSMVGQSRSLGIFIYIPKIKEPMVKSSRTSTSLFFHWNRKSKTDDPVIISSLAFTPETLFDLMTYVPFLSHPVVIFGHVSFGKHCSQCLLSPTFRGSIR